jgi:hypothetical protein
MDLDSWSWPHTKDKSDHIQPRRYFRNLTGGSPTFSHQVSQSNKALVGRPAITRSGRCLGGGSSANFTNFITINFSLRFTHLSMPSRAAASGYDDWEKLFDNPSWGSKELISLVKKVRDQYFSLKRVTRLSQAETYQAPGDRGIHRDSKCLLGRHWTV